MILGGRGLDTFQGSRSLGDLAPSQVRAGLPDPKRRALTTTGRGDRLRVGDRSSGVADREQEIGPEPKQPGPAREPPAYSRARSVEGERVGVRGDRSAARGPLKPWHGLDRPAT